MIGPRTKPTPAATRLGTVILLPNTGDLPNDILAALEAAGLEAGTFTADDIRRMMQGERISRALRAEAGVSYGRTMSVIFYTKAERLATGRRVCSWLMLLATPAGDAVSWNTSIMDDDYDAIMAADLQLVGVFMRSLRKAANGPSTEQSEYRADVPGDEDLAALEED